MYNLDSLIGKVVTIRSISGSEIICKLLGVNPEKTVLTVGSPKTVLVDQNSVVMLPFTLTSNIDTVYLSMQNIFAIMETMRETAEDYINAVQEERELADAIS